MKKPAVPLTLAFSFVLYLGYGDLIPRTLLLALAETNRMPIKLPAEMVGSFIFDVSVVLLG